MLRVERIPLAYNNVYFVTGGGSLAVIDTGPDYRGARETILAALAGRTPDLVIATHGHLDHAGLGRWWHQRGVPVWLGALDAPYAGGQDFAYESMAAYVEGCGAPAAVVVEVLDGLRLRLQWHERVRHAEGWTPSRDGRWPTQLRYDPFEPAALLPGGCEAAAGLRVLPAPGHTPGNLVVAGHTEAGPILFSGDTLLPEITPTPAIQFEGGARFPSLPRFLDSLGALDQFDGGFVECFPGHGEPFRDVTAVIRANLDQARDRTARVEEVLRAGPASVYEVAGRVYPRALRRRFWQIIATVQGHLDVLAESGRALLADGQWRAV